MKDCEGCGQKIRFEERSNGTWKAVDPDGSQHDCKAYKRLKKQQSPPRGKQAYRKTYKARPGRSKKTRQVSKGRSIEQKLQEPVDVSEIVQIDEDGFEYDYLPSTYVKAELNEIFGPSNWGFEIAAMELVESYQTEEGFVAGVKCVCRIHYVAPNGEKLFKDGSAVGHNINQPASNPFRAREQAGRTAESRALVRAAHTMGWRLGLGLYFNPVDRTDSMISHPEPDMYYEYEDEVPF